MSRAARLPASLWTVTVLGYAALVVLVLGTAEADEGLGPRSLPILFAIGTFVVSYSTVGALVATKLPSIPIGWFASIAGLSYALAGSFLLYAEEGIPVDPRPGAEVLYQLSMWMWLAGIVFGGPLLVLFFPTGRLPSRRWRPVAAAVVIGLATLALTTTFMPGPPEPGVRWTNPLGIAGAGPTLDLLARFGGLLLIVGSLAALASVFVRYRGAPSGERDQLKWFFFALVVAGVVALPVGLILEQLGLYEASNFVITASLSLIPLSIGAAILRHRIFDIDVVINKALVYGALTAILALAYLGLVVSLQGLIAPVTEDSDLAVAGSTLAVAALFSPIRTRVQTFIDRRFYRRRYDAAATLGAFSAQLRDRVDLEALGRELVGVVGSTMQPAHASLWLRPTERGAPS
ncbi:MAG TPA: hypothetical protein VJ927_00460 [Actinomycetota bacterium]|nr:hypothetical protein [Actinomycetota bacterium]